MSFTSLVRLNSIWALAFLNSSLQAYVAYLCNLIGYIPLHLSLQHFGVLSEFSPSSAIHAGRSLSTFVDFLYICMDLSGASLSASSCGPPFPS